MSAPKVGEFDRIQRDFRVRKIGWWLIVAAMVTIGLLFLSNSVNAQEETCPRYRFNSGEIVSFSSFTSTGNQDAHGRCQIIFRSNFEEMWLGSAFVRTLAQYSTLRIDVINVRYRFIVERNSFIIKQVVELSEPYEIRPAFGVIFQSYHWGNSDLEFLNGLMLATYIDQYGLIVLLPDSTAGILTPDVAHG